MAYRMWAVLSCAGAHDLPELHYTTDTGEIFCIFSVRIIEMTRSLQPASSSDSKVNFRPHWRSFAVGSLRRQCLLNRARNRSQTLGVVWVADSRSVERSGRVLSSRSIGVGSKNQVKKIKRMPTHDMGDPGLRILDQPEAQLIPSRQHNENI